jgi:hypothetical protein
MMLNPALLRKELGDDWASGDESSEGDDSDGEDLTRTSQEATLSRDDEDTETDNDDNEQKDEDKSIVSNKDESQQEREQPVLLRSSSKLASFTAGRNRIQSIMVDYVWLRGDESEDSDDDYVDDYD